MKIIGERMINTTWFAEYEDHNDGTVTLVNYYRLHNNQRQSWPIKNHTAYIITSGKLLHEDDKRFVLAINTEDGKKEVRNRKHVFDYGYDYQRKGK